MVRKVLGSMLVLAMLLAAGCATGESFVSRNYDFSKVEKVAIVEVTGPVGGEAAKNELSDYFAMELVKKGYRVVERSQVHAILKEQEFQASDLTTSEGAAQAGRILNVPAVIILNIPEFAERIRMTAKMINTEDASIAWIGSGRGTTGRTIVTVLGALFGAGAGYAVGGDSKGKAIGAAAGGVVGGVGGYVLSPQKASQAQKVIRKVCRNLPSP